MSFIFTDNRLSNGNFRHERHLYSIGFKYVAGCDEVGRGPLAGPVVAACVILPPDCDSSVFLDSKILSHKKLVILNDFLHEIDAQVGIGIVSEKEIDKINILQASLLAMKLATERIKIDAPDFLLVDGKFQVPVDTAQETLIKGESKSASIAAASIAAKVKRDLLMVQYDTRFPGYNFAKNKGYPTKEHRLAIQEIGPCPIHRKTFKGVKEYVKQETKTW